MDEKFPSTGARDLGNVSIAVFDCPAGPDVGIAQSFVHISPYSEDVISGVWIARL